MYKKEWYNDFMKIKKMVDEIEKIDEVKEVLMTDFYRRIIVNQNEDVDDDTFFETHENLKKKIKKITKDLSPHWCVVYGNWYRCNKKNKTEFLKKVKEIAEKIEDIPEVKFVEIDEFNKDIYVKLHRATSESEDLLNHDRIQEVRSVNKRIKEITGSPMKRVGADSSEWYFYFEDIHV